MVSLGAGAAATVAGATAAAGGTLFEYNRKNFLYDRKMRVETEYTINELRIKRADMYRQDIEDIRDQTVVKMDTYLLINAVVLGFVVMAYCEGKLAAGTPAWLTGANTLCLGGAFAYLLMSTWLAMHATVTGRSYGVRLLTQMVRLPIPSWAQLEGARTYGSAFEKLEARQMFRIPFVLGSQEDVLRAEYEEKVEDVQSHPDYVVQDEATAEKLESSKLSLDSKLLRSSTMSAAAAKPNYLTSADPWGLEARGDKIYELDGSNQANPSKLRHIQMIRECMQYWQAYDAFARVSMTMGIVQLALGIGYYVDGYVMIDNQACAAAFFLCALIIAVGVRLVGFDISWTFNQRTLGFLLMAIGPISLGLAAKAWAMDESPHGIYNLNVLVPLGYYASGLWLLLVYSSMGVREQRDNLMLPTGFRSALYLDMYSWIGKPWKGEEKQFAASIQQSSVIERPGILPRPENVTGNGPANQTVRYKDGLPMPVRPEQLPGASRPFITKDVTKDDLKPFTFVPLDKDEPESGVKDSQVQAWTKSLSAGERPWMLFKGATLLLAFLWLFAGTLFLLELIGVLNIKVHPLLTRDTVHIIDATLETGSTISTSWPHQDVRPFALACDSASHTMVASTRFGLYFADLSELAEGRLNFKTAALCPDIKGEPVLDVSLHCTSPGNCKASVLHQQGQKLSTCSLVEQHGQLHPAASLLDTQQSLIESLSNSNSASESEERILSMATASKCNDIYNSAAEDCSYVSTNGNNIVEMRPRSAEGKAVGEWYPHRVLRSALNGTAKVYGGAMDVIDNRYLGLLQSDEHRLEVLDLQNAGAYVKAWKLPAISAGNWTSMCASGSDLFFLSHDAEVPQISHLPVSALGLEKKLPRSSSSSTSAQGISAPQALAHGQRKSHAPSQRFLGL